ncbi:hypothetical protein CERSUDRAFT_162401 [Gelatoporia subvermispora B]|uniref:Uncharacterized protein n=1 Tax=Ceriporiopsis subvermispora (strain B) TaxID=914234 RepID=M2P968_CERS8|nr:hypothetical protein CERSUDRAFT_162401 [Gelatoporia subvermispora B]
MASTSILENAYYVTNYLSGIMYGIELSLFYVTVHSVYTMPKLQRRKSDKVFVLYSIALLFLLTVDIATNAFWGQQMWITFRDQPGGIPAFIAHEESVWYETWGTAASIALIFLGDGLLIFRCYIIWGSSLLVILLPCLTYLANIVLGILVLIEAGAPGGTIFSGKAINFGIPFYSIAIGLNILLTALICGRLLYISNWVRETLGNDAAKLYTGVLAITIESAIPYSLCGMMFLIPYVRGSQSSIGFAQIWGKFTCLSPQLIVFRVVTRRAWSNRAMTQDPSAITFSSGGLASNHASQPASPYGSGHSSDPTDSATWPGDRSIKNMV